MHLKIKQTINLTEHLQPRHRALPALAVLGDTVIIAFREGTGHVANYDGCLKLAISDDLEHWCIQPIVPENELWDVRVNHGMTTLSNGTILLPYNLMQIHKDKLYGDTARTQINILKSNDGYGWAPHYESEPGILFPYGRILELDDNKLLMPVHEISESFQSPWALKYNFPHVSKLRTSKNGGRSWTLSEIARDDKLHFNETEIIQLDDKLLLAIMREETQWNGYCALSYDLGKTWNKPFSLKVWMHSPSMTWFQDSIILAFRAFDVTHDKFMRNQYKPRGTMLCTSEPIEKPVKTIKWLDNPLDIEDSNSWDCAYPSLAVRGDELLCAYYSDAAGGACDIKLAILEAVEK